MRVKRGVTASAKHKKIIKAAKGMQHSRTRSFLDYPHQRRCSRKRHDVW